jgi:hypothetical protein
VPVARMCRGVRLRPESGVYVWRSEVAAGPELDLDNFARRWFGLSGGIDHKDNAIGRLPPADADEAQVAVSRAQLQKRAAERDPLGGGQVRRDVVQSGASAPQVKSMALVATRSLPSTDELGRGFLSPHDEWSAHMTADIDFYTRLALEADGPLVG